MLKITGNQVGVVGLPPLHDDLVEGHVFGVRNNILYGPSVNWNTTLHNGIQDNLDRSRFKLKLGAV